MPVPPAWTADLAGGLSLMSSPAVRHLHREGRLTPVRIPYSELPDRLARDLRPALAVIAGRPAAGGFRLGLEAGYAVLAARLAGEVVIEADPSLPEVPDAPLIRRPARIVGAASAAPDAPAIRSEAIDRAIGAAMAALVPAGATIQCGPGAIGDAAVGALEVPVAVHSGLISDAIAHLARRGLLRGRATAAYLYGGAPVRELAASGAVALRGIEETHDAARLAALRRLQALNSAFTVGLDGSVNVERAGGLQMAGIGGHRDFCAAVAGSPGGLSIVGLRSTGPGGSRIVPAVEVVSTPGRTVDVVVTEHGVARLRGLSPEGRRRALIEIADPGHREWLERA